jgi:hypothetical protein
MRAGLYRPSELSIVKKRFIIWPGILDLIQSPVIKPKRFRRFKNLLVEETDIALPSK